MLTCPHHFAFRHTETCLQADGLDFTDELVVCCRHGEAVTDHLGVRGTGWRCGYRPLRCRYTVLTAEIRVRLGKALFYSFLLSLQRGRECSFDVGFVHADLGPPRSASTSSVSASTSPMARAALFPSWWTMPPKTADWR